MLTIEGTLVGIWAWLRCILTIALLVTSSTARANRFDSINFEDGTSSRVLNEAGLEVTVQPISDDEYSERAVAAIRYPGFQPLIIELESAPKGHSRSVGIGKLVSSDTVPSVIFQSFSGGAHCCSTILAAVPIGNRFQIVSVGTWDGEGISEFPRDVDGDGISDFVMSDGSFNYAFSSYAGSWAPPQVKSVFRGQVIDLSAQPQFGSLYEAFSKKARLACADRLDPDRNGACAGYVASEARLGRLEAALKFADQMSYKGSELVLPSKCKVEYANSVCPEGQEVKFASFYSAIRWFLIEYGYVQ